MCMCSHQCMVSMIRLIYTGMWISMEHTLTCMCTCTLLHIAQLTTTIPRNTVICIHQSTALSIAWVFLLLDVCVCAWANVHIDGSVVRVRCRWASGAVKARSCLQFIECLCRGGWILFSTAIRLPFSTPFPHFEQKDDSCHHKDDGGHHFSSYHTRSDDHRSMFAEERAVRLIFSIYWTCRLICSTLLIWMVEGTNQSWTYNV